MLSQRVSRIGFSPTLEVADLARRLKAEGRDVIDFSAGQPDFPTPEDVKQRGKLAIDENRTRYTATAGLAELRQAAADRIRRDLGVDYAADQLLISPGAKASLYFAFMALAEAGQEVLVPSPYWTSYPEQIRLTGAEPVFVDCPEENGFKLTPESLAAAITPRTRVLILNYPSNPTGACYTKDELAPLAEICVQRDIWVIADEIYSKMLYDGRGFSSIVELGPEVAARTVLIDGMSKTYSMTGWRIGYAAGPIEAIKAMTKLQSHSTSNATSISQWASVTALELSPSQLAPRLKEFDRRRHEMVRLLREIPGVTCMLPEGAFYVFPNVSGCFREERSSGQALAKFLLEEAGVAVVPGEAFGSARHIRLSYAVSVEEVREGVERMTRALARA